jgi:hypothetical protein
MRTTLALSEDVFLFAKQRAASERVSIGEMVSRLMRIGIQAEAHVSQHAKPQSKYGLLPARSEIITSEHVYRLMEQESI